METVKEKLNKAYDVLKDRFGYSNNMSAPKLVKVVINSGTGRKKDKKFNEMVSDRLTKITGQRPAPRLAKKSIATFKLREGDVVGFSSTLRGSRMYSFVDKLIHVALPRTRDFQGLSRGGIDEMGNYSIGIKEHTIFPETSDEDLKDVFGMTITFVTTAKTRKETEALLEYLKVPFVEKVESN